MACSTRVSSATLAKLLNEAGSLGEADITEVIADYFADSDDDTSDTEEQYQDNSIAQGRNSNSYEWLE